MPGNPKQKIKILYLLKILYEKTDEEHTMTINEIISELSEADINAERKSIYSDFALLNDFGFEIGRVKSREVGYYYASREFSVSDLTLLEDNLKTSKYIPYKRRLELEKKLEKLTCVYNRPRLHRQIFTSNRLKNVNERTYANVELLHRALSEKKKISFFYNAFIPDKQNKYKKTNLQYKISPYRIAWDNELYYLIGGDSNKDEALIKFNVSRIRDIQILEENRIDVRIAAGDIDFDLDKYMEGLFSVSGSDTEKIAIEFNTGLMAVMSERFHEDAVIKKIDDEHYLLTVDEEIPSDFIPWLLQFGGSMRLLSPLYLVEEIKDIIKELYSSYDFGR